MKSFLYLALAAAAIYGFSRLVPDGTTHKALAAVGLADFWDQKIPVYLRGKLSIPENPVTKRKKLLDELSQNLTGVERALEAVVPVTTTGSPTPLSSIPEKSEVRDRIEKSREFLAKSETALKELENANTGQGIFQKTAERLLDKILPPPSGGSDAVCASPQSDK